MPTAAELVLLFKTAGTDKVVGDLDSVGKKGGRLGPMLAVGAAAGATAIAGIGIASLKMAADFDQSMREVNTLVNLPADQFDMLKGKVLDLSREMGVTSGEAVPALYQAISAGVPPENAVDFLRIASKAAIGGVTTLETATDGLTTALNAFQLSADQTEHVADVLFQGVKSGKTTMDELSKSLFNVAPLAKAAGIGLEETVAATAALTTAGVPTSVATTQIRAAIQGLLKPSEDMEKIFKAAGFESGQLAIKQRGLVGALKVVTDATEGDIGALTKLLGSVEGVGAALSLTGAQGDIFASTLDAMTNQTGQAQTAYDEMNKGLNRQVDIIKNSLNVAMLQLGGVILPIVADALQRLPGVLDRIGGLFGDMRGALSGLVAVILPWVQWMRFAAETGDLLNDFLEDLPQPVRDAVNVLVRFMDTLDPNLTAAIQNVSFFIRGVMAVLRDFWEAHWEDIKQILMGVWDIIQGYVQVAWSIISGIITVGLAVLAGDWSGAWNGIKEMLRGVWAGIELIVSGYWAALTGVLAIGFAALKGVWDAFWSGLGTTVENIFTGIKDAVKGGINYLIGKINEFIAKYMEIRETMWENTGGLITLPGIEPIPFLARGGQVVRAGAAIIGERGPEVVSLPRGARVSPMGMAPVINIASGAIVVNGLPSGVDTRQLARIVAIELGKEIRERRAF